MRIEAKIKRIGGSTFALLPPDVVKALRIVPGNTVQLEIKKRGMTGPELKAFVESLPPWHGPPLTDADLDTEGDRMERLERRAGLRDA